MFWVFNKQKIYSYLACASAVIILLVCSIVFMGTNMEAMEIGAEAGKLVPIYSVETNKQRIAITINCAWNADDIDKILEVLDRRNVKVTFFMVGEWVDKYQEEVKKIHDAGHEIRKSLRYSSSCKQSKL